MDQIFYVSSAGSNTSPYDTWAKAATKLKTATDMAGTRDKIYVDSAHTESTTGAVTLAVAGDVQICRASTSAEPPTELGTYGVDITYTGSLTFSGSFYCQGISFNAGAGSSTFNFIFGSTNADRQIFKDCCFYFGTTGVSSTFLFGASTASNASYLLFLAPLFYSIGSSAVQALSLRNAFVEMWAGDYFDENYGTTAAVVASSGVPANAYFNGVQFGIGYTGILSTIGSSSNGNLQFVNCDLGSNFDTYGTWCSVYSSVNANMASEYAQNGTTRYEQHYEANYCGVVTSDYDIRVVDGATNRLHTDTTAYSYRLATTAAANCWGGYLRSPELIVWNEGTGSPVTVEVDIANTNGSVFTESQCWLEVRYKQSPRSNGVHVSDSFLVTTIVPASASIQTMNDAAWAGSSSLVKQKLSVTFTPGRKGFLSGRVYFTKPSSSVYVNPKMRVY